MHRFRREAKYAAWYDQEGRQYSVNPFRKIRHPQQSSPIAAQSLDQSPSGDVVPSGIRRANTLPEHLTTSIEHQPLTRAQSLPNSKTKDDTLSDLVDEARKEAFSTTLSNTITSHSPYGEEKPRPRQKFKNMFKRHLETDNYVGESHNVPKVKFTAAGQFRDIFFSSWINILLLAIPAGITVRYVIGYSVVTFVVNFIATIPLVLLVGYAADELQLRAGLTLGNLINVTAR